MQVWKSPLFDQFPNLEHGLTLKEAGNMSFKFPGLRPEENRRLFFRRLEIGRRFNLHAVHGGAVAKLPPVDLGDPGDYDAAYTLERGVYIFGTFADCLPVFFYDPQNQVVGLAHAGWRGVLAGVVPNTVKALGSGGVEPRELFVSVGPHIQGKCFEVGADVAGLFGSTKPKIDLKGIVFDQLVAAGLDPNKVYLSEECTHCDSKFFSNRQSKRKGAMLAFIGLRAAGTS